MAESREQGGRATPGDSWLGCRESHLSINQGPGDLGELPTRMGPVAEARREGHLGSTHTLSSRCLQGLALQGGRWACHIADFLCRDLLESHGVAQGEWVRM